MLANDFKQGLQAGLESVFTYGPLGYFFTPTGVFDHELYSIKFACELVGKAVVVFGLLSIAPRLRPLLRCLYFAVLLVVAMAMFDAVYLLAISLLTVWLLRHESPSKASLILVPSGLAVLALVKFTFALLAVFSIACLAVARVRSSWRHALCVVGSFVAALVVASVLARQSPMSLVAYVRSSLEICRGYNESMALLSSVVMLAFGAAAWLALVPLAASTMRARHGLSSVMQVAVVGATAFLMWKSGVVRQDMGHMLVWFSGISVLPFVLWSLVSGPRTRMARACFACLVAIGVVGALHAGRVVGAGFLDVPGAQVRRLTWNVRLLANAKPYWQAHVELLGLTASRNRLERTATVVKDGTVDLLGHAQGLLILNVFNIRHRPVFHSYSAYTPYLQNLNAAFFRGERGPDFVLAALDPIDQHFPLADDAGAWIEVLLRYLPVLEERGMLLMRRDPRPVEEHALGETTVQFGERMAVPDAGDGLLVVQLDTALNLLGQSASFLMRPPTLILEVTTDDGKVSRFRSAPSVLRRGFVLSPLIRTSRDINALKRRELPRIRSVRVTTSAGILGSAFRRRVRATWKRLRRRD